MYIGLTGGIGSGKSVVAKILKNYGYAVYDSDEQAKYLTNNSPSIRQKLTERFGQAIYDNNMLNKALLAKYIFSSAEDRLFVNSVIHPAVKNNFLEMYASSQQIVFLEAAILFESGFNRFMDKTVLVSAPENIRIARTVKRDQCTELQAQARIAAQTTTKELLEKVDYVLHNDDAQLLLPQIENLLNTLNSNSHKL